MAKGAALRVLVFDSGVGGLGIAREVRRRVPDARLTYLMDDAGFPYGSRTDADLLARVLGVIEAGLAAVRPQLVVVACNTATTVALAALRARHRLVFVGCVPPLKSAAAASRSKVIGVLATPATVRGPYLRALAARVAPHCRLVAHAAPGLAALAEARFAGRAVAQGSVGAELGGLADAPGLDAVAIGCTHYAWLLPELRACLPAHVVWLDPAVPVAAQAARMAATLDSAPGGEDGLVLRTGAGDLSAAGWAACAMTRVGRLDVSGQAVLFQRQHREDLCVSPRT